MTVEEFRASSEPPSAHPPLAALWHDSRGDWDRAHHFVQEDSSRAAAWVHAYLHRKEGDTSNGRYWYSRAGKTEFTGSLEAEWDQLVAAFLAEK